MYVSNKRAIVGFSLCSCLTSAALAQSLQLDFIDKDTGEPVSCRVEPTLAPKRFPKTRSSPTSGKTILFEETAKLKPAPGKYEFTASRGIEYADIEAGFELDKNGNDKFDVVFVHSTKMNELNWFSGDLASDLPADTLARWSAAEGLNLTVSLHQDDRLPNTAEVDPPKQPASADLPEQAPPFVLTTHTHRLRAAKDRTALTFHPVRSSSVLPESIRQATSAYECIDAINSLSRDEWVIELSDYHGRDLPIILALIPVDTVQVLTSPLQRNAPNDVKEAFYNPDPKRFFDQKGLGRLLEFAYWQMLEAGFKVAPSAGSHFYADGKTIVGYNRVYTWIDAQQERLPETWWKNYKQGFSFITNGPLLRVSVNGQPPGITIQGTSGQPLFTDLQTDLTVRDEVDYLDIIYNGETKYQAKLEEHARRGKFPELSYGESGWMLVRVVTTHGQSYRFASTSPTYFEFDGRTRVSRKAVRFFQDWLDAAAKEIAMDPVELELYGPWLTKAQRYWTEKSLSTTAP